MSKVYVLFEYEIESNKSLNEVVGIVSGSQTAQIWDNSNTMYNNIVRGYLQFELDDPELLNRIAKTKIGEDNV